MNLDEDELYIKIVSLDVIYNYVIKKFLFEIVWVPKYCFNILDFEI
jgi:hypothetical protein